MLSVVVSQPTEGDLLRPSNIRVVVDDDSLATVALSQQLQSRDGHRVIAAVERHGGRTWAEASVNHGATFFISFPV
jgi:hypothetical protein